MARSIFPICPAILPPRCGSTACAACVECGGLPYSADAANEAAHMKKGLQRMLQPFFASAALLRLLRAAAVFAGAGIDFDLVALAHEQRHVDVEAGGNLG